MNTTRLGYGARCASWVLLAAMLSEQRADACGGCFTRVVTTTATKSNQVITDHRMVLALSAEQTTLWDQIRYAGSPDDFIWVLPVQHGASLDVGLGDNAFMDAMDRLGAPIVTGVSQQVCPGAAGSSSSMSTSSTVPSGGGGCGGGRDFSYTPGSAGSGNPLDSSVVDEMQYRGSESTMLGAMGMATVGPYAVEVLTPGNGGEGFDAWTRRYGYAIPSETRAAVQYYVDLGFDFVVMRLRPEAGVQQMQPIRITFRGYVPTLPLRMVAAGVADKVGLNLTVLANGRMQTRDFRNEVIRDSELTFDFATRRSNYRQLFQARIDALRGHVWVTESVQSLPQPMMQYDPTADAGVRPMDGGVRDAGARDGGYDDVTAMVPDDAGRFRSDPFVDRRIAFTGLPGIATVTRLRTELARVDLDRDLVLEPGPFGWVSPDRRATTVINDPPCPGDAGAFGGTAPPACTPAPSPPRSGCACAAGVGHFTGPGLLASALMALAIRRRRRRP
jgi:hypothetical protein